MPEQYPLRLREHFEATRSLLCVGIDPILQRIPASEDLPGEAIVAFYHSVFEIMDAEGLVPGALKFNIAFFHALDRPLDRHFEGSKAMASLLIAARNMFPGMPCILDAKRGDIEHSNAYYAQEAFDAWGCDAVTASPYLGVDALCSLWRPGKGVYVLVRSSNESAAEIQTRKSGGKTLSCVVGEKLCALRKKCPGLGAVLGATDLESFEDFVSQDSSVPLLVPGVGTQGGDLESLLETLRRHRYDLSLVRVNSSRSVVYPWGAAASGAQWKTQIREALRDYHDRTRMRS